MRLPVLIGLGILGVLVLKGLLVVAILLGVTVVLPLFLTFAILVGLVGGLVLAPVLAVRFLLYCLRGFRASPVVVAASPRPPEPPPLSARPHHEPWSPRTSYSDRRRCAEAHWAKSAIVLMLLVLCVAFVAKRSSALHGTRATRVRDSVARAAEHLRDRATDWALAVRPAPRTAPVESVEADVDASGPPWVHTGVGVTEDDAYQSALRKAQKDLVAYLRAQSPPIRWTPTLDELGRVAHLTKEGRMKDFGKDVGLMYEAHVRVDLTSQDRALIGERDRSEQLEDRVSAALRVLLGAVVVLAGVAGYVRLDDWSKGYYTNWLRVGVAGVVAAACGLFWHFTF